MKTSETININDCTVTISIQNNLRTNNGSGPITLQQYLIAKDICNRYEKALKVAPFATTLIQDYPFSARLLNCLRSTLDWETGTLQDLYDLVAKEGKPGLMKYRNFGKKSWEEVVVALAKLNTQP